MRLKKLMAIALIITTIASTDTSFAFADTTTATDTTPTTTTIDGTATPTPTVTPRPEPAPKSFKDIKKNSTYYTAVTKIAKLGAIGGYSDGTFNAKKKMSNAKYISILVRALDKKQARATAGQDYDFTLMQVALDKKIITPSELSPSDYSSSLTQGNMAVWTARAVKAYSGEDTLADLDDIENLINGYSKIPSKYQTDIREAYSEGIITTKNFNYSGKVTRGTAVNVILRARYPKERRNMSKVKIPDAPIEKRESITIKWSDKTKTKLPHAGDTFIDKNGKKTVLTSFWWKGHEIVGVEQGVKDLYGNYAYVNGEVVKAGKIGDSWDSTTDEYLGSVYVIDKKTGIGLWSITWGYVADYYMTKAEKIKNPKIGDTYGPHDWCVYTDAFGGAWEWTAPR